MPGKVEVSASTSSINFYSPRSILPDPAESLAFVRKSRLGAPRMRHIIHASRPPSHNYCLASSRGDGTIDSRETHRDTLELVFCKKRQISVLPHKMHSGSHILRPNTPIPGLDVLGFGRCPMTDYSGAYVPAGASEQGAELWTFARPNGWRRTTWQPPN